MQLGNEAEPHGEFVSAVVGSYADSRGETVWNNKINKFLSSFYCGYPKGQYLFIRIHLN